MKIKEKSTISSLKNCKAQEEMIGFGLIMVITIIILVVLLGFSLNNSSKESVESYEVEGFLQSAMQYTTDCKDSLEYLSIQKLVIDCKEEKSCIDGRDTCNVLNATLNEIIKESWRIGEDRPIKGSELAIIIKEELFLLIQEGNITQSYESGKEDYSKFEVSFKAYY